MKTIFRKPTPQEVPVEQPNKSRFQLILDEYTAALEDFNSAHAHLDKAAHYFSTLMMDAEKGMNFIDRFRRDLTETIEEAGGSVANAASIEEQLSDFIPKHVKRDGQAQEVQS